MMISRLVRVSCITAGLLFAALTVQAQHTRTWLMLNVTTQESVFSTDPKEQAHLAKEGWKTNGEAALLSANQPNTAAMQRLFKVSDKGVDRIFAISAEEATAATKSGYVNEGTLGQASTVQSAPTMVPVYRFTKDARNLWLIDPADQAWAEKAGWKLKGVAFWLWPKTSKP